MSNMIGACGAGFVHPTVAPEMTLRWWDSCCSGFFLIFYAEFHQLAFLFMAFFSAMEWSVSNELLNFPEETE